MRQQTCHKQHQMLSVRFCAHSSCIRTRQSALASLSQPAQRYACAPLPCKPFLRVIDPPSRYGKKSHQAYPCSTAITSWRQALSVSINPSSWSVTVSSDCVSRAGPAGCVASACGSKAGLARAEGRAQPQAAGQRHQARLRRLQAASRVAKNHRTEGGLRCGRLAWVRYAPTRHVLAL